MLYVGMRLLLNKIIKASNIKLAYQPISQSSVKKKPNPAFIKNELKLKKTKIITQTEGLCLSKVWCFKNV